MAAGSAGESAGSNTELRWPHVTAAAGSTHDSLRRLTLRHHHRTISTSWVALAVVT